MLDLLFVERKFVFGDGKFVEVEVFGRFEVVNVLVGMENVMKRKDMISVNGVGNFLGVILVKFFF